MELVKKIEIVCMNGEGWNAAVPGGPWATAETPEQALRNLLTHIAEGRKYQLAIDNREELPPWMMRLLGKKA